MLERCKSKQSLSRHDNSKAKKKKQKKSDQITTDALNSYECSQDDADFTYHFVRDVIESFDVDGGKFYPLFFDSISGDESVFKNLNRCSIILGSKLPVLAHLHGSITPESSFSKICEFFEKEQNIIKYFSGYVTKTLYCRLKKSAEHRSHSNIKYLSILLAGRDSSDYLTKDDNFINVKKRSNLWKAGKLLLTFLIFSLFLRTFSGLMFQTRK